MLTSARCVNCHPAGDRPLQGETHRLHQPPVARGPDGFGTPAMRCATCHQSANFDPAGVPGHPHWHLAPSEMAWQNKSPGDICTQIKDPARNGGRSLQQILTHVADRFAGRLGLGARSRPRAGSRHAKGTGRAHPGMAEHRSGVSKIISSKLGRVRPAPTETSAASKRRPIRPCTHTSS